jgi:hypothetical protein
MPVFFDIGKICVQFLRLAENQLRPLIKCLPVLGQQDSVASVIEQAQMKFLLQISNGSGDGWL